MHYSPSLFTTQQLIDDTFLDLKALNNYHQEFDLVYNQTFGEFPPQSFKQYCRYQCGLIVYHSTLYNRRSTCTSFNVCVKDETDRSKSVLFYGQVLFCFYVANEPFFFFKRYSRSKNLFSTLLRAIEIIPDWSVYLDRYYVIIRHSLSQLVIFRALLFYRNVSSSRLALNNLCVHLWN